MANSSLVSTSIETLSEKSIVTSPRRRSPTECKRGTAPSSSQQVPQVSGLDRFRETLVTEGISETSATLISASRRLGAVKHYISAWRKWDCWCAERQVCPIECSLNVILDFLANLFEQGLEYSTIGTHRSAISAYHSVIDGKKVGDHPRVSALMKGIFNSRPPEELTF